MNKRRSGLLVVVLALVLLVSMVSMASAAQTWHMKDTASGAAGANYEMQKGSGNGTNIYLMIAKGDSKIWAADQSVAVDGGIDMIGEWTGQIRADGTGSFDAKIGRLSSGGDFTGVDTDSKTVSGKANYTISFSPSNFPLSKGEYLALELINTHASNDLRIYVQYFDAPSSPSYLRFTNDDPAYPVPELSTLLLTCTGVLMLGGFVVYSRRRNNN